MLHSKPRYDNGYELPPGAVMKPKPGKGLKQGSYKIMNEQNEIIAKLKFVNDNLDGLAIFYENGEIREKCTYRNNVIDGWGLALKNNKEVARYQYSQGELKRQLQLEQGMDDYWKETDVSTNNTIGYFHLDTVYARYGIGFVFNNNTIASVIEYKNDIENRKLKEFQNGEMIEYNGTGDVCYQGNYKDDMKNQYPRNGKGDEIVDGEVTYSGEWVDNIKQGQGTSYRRGAEHYTGNWANNLPEGNGSLFDESGIVKYKGNWEKGRYYIPGSEHDWYDYPTDSIVEQAPPAYDNGISIPLTNTVPTDSLKFSTIPDLSVSTGTTVVIDGNLYAVAGYPDQTPVTYTTETPASYVPQTPGMVPAGYVASTPGMVPGGYVAPTPAGYMAPDYGGMGGLPPSEIPAPVVISTDPVTVTNLPMGQTKPLKKPGSKNKKIAIIIIIAVILLLLIGGGIFLLWYFSTPTITVNSMEELENLDWRVGEIIVPSSSYNSVSDVSFSLDGFERLKKLTIRDSACKQVIQFTLSNLPKLETVIIQRESFNNAPNWQELDIDWNDRAFAEFKNCPLLQTITIEAGCFVSYGKLTIES